MSRFAEQLEWIDSRRDDMARLVAAWAEINSGSHHLPGLERCAAAVRQEVDRLEVRSEFVLLRPQVTVDDAGREQTRELGKLIRAAKHPAAPVQVLLGIHYDTVYGPDDPFQHVSRPDAGTLVGPGVADAKGGIVVMLTALAALERSPQAERIGWELFLNPDEEIGSAGSGPMIAEMARGKAAALLFEPSLPDGSLVGERKGSGNFTAVVTGRSAHAGRDPHLGRNAIHALAEFVVAVASMTDFGAGLTVNVGKITGGGAVNVVPDLASCRFNVRVRSAEQQRAVERKLADLQREFNTHDGLALRLYGGFTAPPKPLTDGTRRLLDLARECGKVIGLDLAHKPSGGVCDGNRLAALGVPTVDTLGPVGGELHSPREYLKVDTLVERAKLAAMVLMSL